MKVISIRFLLFLYLLITVNIFPQDLTIIYTSSLNGEIFGCNCKNNPKSGIARVGYIINKLKIKYPDHILIDSGDIFSLDKNRELSNIILDIYSILDYQSVAVGDQELLNGIQDRKLKFFLSSNVEQKNVDYYKIININEKKIGIFSLLNPSILTFYPKLKKKTIINNIYETTDKMIKILQTKGCDFLILLSHLGSNEEINIAKEYETIDIIISGHSQKVYENPIMVNNTLIFGAGANGYRVGVIVINFENNSFVYNHYFEYANYKKTPALPEIDKIVKDYKKNIVSDSEDLIF